MEYVTEKRFVELLNEELAKDPRGAHLRPFVLGPKGFNWPHDGAKNDMVYRRIVNSVREKYGIYH